MRPLDILHLLPHVPPTVCGVAYSAWTLARQLRAAEGMDSRFLIANTEHSQPSTLSEFPVAALPRRSASALRVALQLQPPPDSVVLHYSPYGFHKRGVPFWLRHGWKSLAALPTSPRRLVMFHEVAASSSPRHSAFWLRPFQLRIARALLAGADIGFTNCTLNHQALETAVGCTLPQVSVLPIPSNFGEPLQPPPPESRSAHLVLFSSNLSSQHGLNSPWTDLHRAAIQMGVERVILVGRPTSPPKGFDLPVQQVGFLSAGEISALLLKVRFGYAFLGPELFAKSGVFAAFAAHGVLPLVPCPAPDLPDGLRAGTHYARIGCPTDLGSPDLLQRALLDWYNAHNLSATAQRFAQNLSSAVSR